MRERSISSLTRVEIKNRVEIIRDMLRVRIDPVLCNQKFLYDHQMQIRQAFALEIADYTQDTTNHSALLTNPEIRFRPGDWVSR
jgi:hypothetical protein